MSTVTIRALTHDDWPAVWEILEPVFRAGDTYALDPDISDEDALRTWVELPEATFVAVGPAGAILGTYYVKRNQGGGGAHVCNCGYVVGAAARGTGVASKMCEHSKSEARRRGYRAMQYNFVVSTNVAAVRLWERHGFRVVGTLPGAFHHPSQGYVDAYVMYASLEG